MIVALKDAGRRIDEVARVFGLTATNVSILRMKARAEGSAGLVKRLGRHPHTQSGDRPGYGPAARDAARPVQRPCGRARPARFAVGVRYRDARRRPGR